MMNMPTKAGVLSLLFVILALFQTGPALARNNDVLQHDIEAGIAESTALSGTRVEVHVVQRLVVLSGQVRLYEQKLIVERIAWTTPGVEEVDNELRVVPKLALSDEAIERRIREIVKADKRFHRAAVETRVDAGRVFLSGSFLRYRDPTVLKHQIAKIEGVVDIEIRARFLAQQVSP